MIKHLRHILTWGYSVALLNVTNYATSENYAA